MKNIFVIVSLFLFFLLFPINNTNAYISKKSGETLCVSKSFNANYRLSKWKCSEDEREIPKGTVEYDEGLEFLKISDLVVGSNSKAPVAYNNNSPNVKLASSKYITKKKSKNTQAIEEIENLYANGFLSKKECVRAKVKILKLTSSSANLCDNVKVKVVHKDDKAEIQNKYISKKEKEKRKSYITKKKKEVEKKQKNKKKFFSSLADLPNGTFYFYAIDKRDQKTLIGYVNPDPKSEVIKLNNRSFRKENLGYLYKEGGVICDVLSIVENSRSSRIYSGSIDVNCPKGFYIGNWVQNGDKGTGNAIDENGNELNYYFFMKRGDAIASKRNKEKETIVARKPQKEKQVKIFQPETETDNEAPTIKTKLKLVSNSPNFTIEGVIKDNKDHKQGPFLEIADQNIEFNKRTGKFSKKLYSPFSTEITIAATDIFGNRKEVVVAVEINETQIAKEEKLEPLNPKKGRNYINPNTVAIVIGIEKYEKVTSSPYSNLDAKYFTQYAKKIAKPQNIITLVDEKATRNESLTALVKNLKSKVRQNETDVFIFFSGHGLAANENDLYLMAKDSDSDLLEFTALNRKEIIKLVSNFNPKSVTMFLDTCYSGVSRKGEQLVASARPIRVKVNDNLDLPNNFNIFSASQASQISSSMDKAKQGIFSYYLMKGLEGNADTNNDRLITNQEMANYLENKVSQTALEIYSREQKPAFVGSSEKVLWKY